MGVKLPRKKTKCRHCGKGFYLVGLPVISITPMSGGRVKVERLVMDGEREKRITYHDGITCCNRCTKAAKREGLRVLNYEKSLEISNTRRFDF